MTDKFVPSVMAFDFETADSKGASVDFWKPDFRAESCAFSWVTGDGEIKRSYREGEQKIAAYLRKLARDNVPMVAHNLQFDYGVTKARFPWFPIHLMKYDTMRLVQVHDQGGTETYDDSMLSLEDQIAWMEGKIEPKTGLGLEASASRLLPSIWHGHKQRTYAILREEHGILPGKEGANLHLLTSEQMESYNTADTDITLLIFQTLTQKFAADGYTDWLLDHQLHVGAIRRLVDLKIQGIRVRQEGLNKFVSTTNAEMKDITDRFATYHAEAINSIETARKDAWVSGPKTEKGRANRLEKAEEHREKWAFNPRSTDQLATLFVDTLGIEPTFWTKEAKKTAHKRKDNPNMKPYQPNPSFKAVHLASYGDGGKILERLKKRQIVGKQASNLLQLAETDGRWHVELRACGTKTGRFAGGGSGEVRLNVQALGRKEQGLMENLLPDEGCELASIDLSAGEPTVTAHYSQDKNYFNACFNMVDKAPFIDQNGVLQIDDIYLMGASKAPTGKALILEAYNTTWNGLTFAERWLEDNKLPEKDRVIRNALAKTRKFHKPVMLALQYGQMPKGMVTFAYDQGFSLSLKDAQDFWKAYWYELFPDVRKLSERLQATFKRRGYLVNEFGYRMVPERASLCLNYQIQSSVSGIMKVYEEKLFAAAPFAQYKGTIHDEVIPQYPIAKREDMRAAAQRATDSLNKDLNWTVNIRTGFAVGSNFYEAK